MEKSGDGYLTQTEPGNPNRNFIKARRIVTMDGASLQNRMTNAPHFRFLFGIINGGGLDCK